MYHQSASPDKWDADLQRLVSARTWCDHQVAVAHYFRGDVQSFPPLSSHSEPSLKNSPLTPETFLHVCARVSYCFGVCHCTRPCIFSHFPSRTRMNQRHKPVPWQTSYESSCLYLSPTELEDNSGWWNTLQSEHQAAALTHNGPVIIVHIITASHSICHADNLIGDQWLAYYILEDFSHLGSTSSSHTRMLFPMVEPWGCEQTGVTEISADVVMVRQSLKDKKNTWCCSTEILIRSSFSCH